jgi:hypothetical protein
MRRPGLVLVVVTLALATGGCGADDDAEPTIPSIDFSPSATIDIDADGLGCTLAEATPGCALPAGSVVEVANRTAETRRLRADDLFDTGAMEPGDTMTVVLVDPGELEVVDVDRPDQSLTVVVTPREG